MIVIYREKGINKPLSRSCMMKHMNKKGTNWHIVATVAIAIAVALVVILVFVLRK